MTLSVIIVSYNVYSLLDQCLKSIFAGQSGTDLEVIVVDNHSYDRTPHLLRGRYPQLTVIENADNLGFARAVNQGLAQAKGEYICLLNPDTIVKPDTFTILVDYLRQNQDVGVVGCKVLDADGNLQLASRRKFPTLLVALPKFLGLSRLFPNSRIFGQYNQTYMNPDTLQEVDAVSGSCMLFPTTVLADTGTFDEQFFMYFEDTDFCYRVKQAGHKVVYNPHTQIIHYKGESLKTAPYNPAEIFHHSMLLFFQKYRHEFRFWPITALLIRLAVGWRKLFLTLMKSSTALVSGSLDLISIIVSFIGAIGIWYPYRYQSTVDLHLIFSHWELILAYVLTWMLAAAVLGLNTKNVLSYGRSLVGSAFTFLMTSTITYLVSYFAYSRAVLLIATLFSALLLAGWRIVVLLLYRYRLIRLSVIEPLFTRKALIVGTHAEALRIGEMLVHSPVADFHLAGYVDKEFSADRVATTQFLGTIEDLDKLVRTLRINEVIFPQTDFNFGQVIEIIPHLAKANVAIKFVSAGDQHLIGKGVIENLGGVPLVDLEFPLFDRMHMLAKRIFDMGIAAVILLVTLPFHFWFILNNQINKKTIWGPQQTHIQLWEYESGTAWIRELPYFLSILTGVMSVVGSQIVDYSSADPHILFKPGLTGLSQLRSADVKQDMVRHFDEFYIQNHSIIFDIEIVLKSMLRI